MIPTQNFEIKILTHPDEILNLIDEWNPNILGFSSYGLEFKFILQAL